MNIWNQLYEAARKVQNERTISPFIEAGGVAAAILTKKGNIYVGVCIDTASTLGMCAERNAIANMMTIRYLINFVTLIKWGFLYAFCNTPPHDNFVCKYNTFF